LEKPERTSIDQRNWKWVIHGGYTSKPLPISPQVLHSKPKTLHKLYPENVTSSFIPRQTLPAPAVSTPNTIHPNHLSVCLPDPSILTWHQFLYLVCPSILFWLRTW